MTHLNCLPPRAAGVNYWFYLLAHLVVGVDIKQNVKCEMLLRKIDGEMNLQNCGFSVKWRRWRHAPRLTAMTVNTDSRHRVSKRWQVVDVKNIAGDDQTTLIVHRNSANIARIFRFTPVYVCVIATVVLRLRAAAVATHPHRRISKRWHVADVKNFTGDDQATLSIDRNATI